MRLVANLVSMGRESTLIGYIISCVVMVGDVSSSNGGHERSVEHEHSPCDIRKEAH